MKTDPTGDNLDIPSDLSLLLPAKARSFSFAARFLPSAERRDVTVLYAFCRTLDDLVDEPPTGVTTSEIKARIGLWRGWLNGRAMDRNLPEPAQLAVVLGELMERTGLPTRYLIALLDGVESDLELVYMVDYISLRRYCLRVAGAVGMAMCHILKATDTNALLAAADLGIAMQLTNILRDLGSDVRSGRMYLPADELERFGCSYQDIQAAANARSRPSRRLEELLRFQVARAREFYGSGLAGVHILPPRLRPAIMIAGRLYRAILDEIEKSGYDVLGQRAYTSTLTKVKEAAITLLILASQNVVAGRSKYERSFQLRIQGHNADESLAEVLSWLE
jgi:15-cis-phytoene synthase